MHFLVATDADWVLADLRAALEEPGVSFTVCRDGRAVSDAVAERMPDLAILDLQIGSMGGMAVTMALRLDESAERFARVPVLMLLDRAADVHMAKRSDADGWLIKPLDALRISRAVAAIRAGHGVKEGLPIDPPSEVDVVSEESPAGESVTSG